MAQESIYFPKKILSSVIVSIFLNMSIASTIQWDLGNLFIHPEKNPGPFRAKTW